MEGFNMYPIPLGCHPPEERLLHCTLPGAVESRGDRDLQRAQLGLPGLVPSGAHGL